MKSDARDWSNDWNEGLELAEFEIEEDSWSDLTEIDMAEQGKLKILFQPNNC